MSRKLNINIVSKDTVTFGNLVTRGSVEIFGKIKLPVRHKDQPAIASNGNIFIAKSAMVEGDIKANNITIEGKLQGSITANGTVSLIDGCIVSGDIESSGLMIGERVVFKGNVINKTTQKQEQVSFIDKIKTIFAGYLLKVKKTLTGIGHADSQS